MTRTPKHRLAFEGSGQGLKDNLNDFLKVFDSLSHPLVLDKDLTAPPGGESEGDTYIVAATATGAWAGQENDLAIYYYGRWMFVTPWKGLAVYVDDEDAQYTYSGSAWGIVVPSERTAHVNNPRTLATGSPTSVAWTGIPSWVTEIHLALTGVSMNNSAALQVVLGDSGGNETTGYVARVRSSSGQTASTTGFILTRTAGYAAANTVFGDVIIRKGHGNRWNYYSSLVRGDGGLLWHGAGSKELSGVLDRLSLGTVAGTPTFDAGTASVFLR